MILILDIFEEIGWQPLYVTSLSAFFTTPFACNRPFMSPLWWSVKFLNIQSYRINESWIKKSPRHVVSRHYKKFDVWIIEKMCYLTKTWLRCYSCLFNTECKAKTLFARNRGMQFRSWLHIQGALPTLYPVISLVSIWSYVFDMGQNQGVFLKKLSQFPVFNQSQANCDVICIFNWWKILSKIFEKYFQMDTFIDRRG